MQRLKNAVELVQMLMQKYGIDIHHVIRHFDVTGKKCPLPLIENLKWQGFKTKNNRKRGIDYGTV